MPFSARSGRSRGSRRRRRPLGAWERLGAGPGPEALEARALLAADLGITIDAPHVCYLPGTEVTYTVTVRNLAAETATGASVSTVLASQITKSTWTAAYSAGARTRACRSPAIPSRPTTRRATRSSSCPGRW